MKCARHTSTKCHYCNRQVLAHCAFRGEDTVICNLPVCGQCLNYAECRIHRIRGDRRATTFTGEIKHDDGA